MKKRLVFTTILAAILAALLAACGPTNGGDTGGDTGGAGEASQPGEGVTVSMVQATLDTGWFQAQVYKLLLEDLGYTVEGPDTLDNPVAYTAIAEGDLDFWPNGWFPLHNQFLEDENIAGNAEPVGFQVESGALQGYLIDKATADEFGITNLGDLSDPEIAAIFDSDGNGQADLIGCNAGWGCEAVINDHIDMFNLGDTIEHVQGEYSALMADTIGRFERGEPVLFYTWTPTWTVSELALGEDVVWLGVPDDPEVEAASIPNCQEDPCDMGFAPNDIRVVANAEFLANNPAAATLFEIVEIPLSDIAEQNVLLTEGEDSPEDIRTHAENWIEENRDQVDSWLEQARAAAE
ncbi:MAG: glycine betaine/L-proline ABC transporter substrate-binding protein ProX [Anaerolineae bacterium]